MISKKSLDSGEAVRGNPETGETSYIDDFERLIGKSVHTRNVIAAVKKLARTDAPALITGESGTGKELVARAIHRQSSRSDGPFVTVNCSAISGDRLESGLFGQEDSSPSGEGARTGGRNTTGRRETLFFDAIGDLTPELQVKLLRFLQNRGIGQVGGSPSTSFESRIIASTNVDLEQAMAEGRFREDLYFRLCVVVIAMPALRDRKEDIQLLAETFLERHARTRQDGLVFEPEALRAMKSYRWPGNIRELENRVERAAIMAEDGKITARDLGIADEWEYQGIGLGKAREAVEREMIESALSRNNGNISRTAADLEISRPTLYERIDRLGINRP